MHSFQNKEELEIIVQQWCLNKNISNLIQKYGDISEWDVSNVTNMSYMFNNCPIDNIYKPILKTFRDTFMIINKIIEGDNECPITLELIDKNDKYLSCET